MYSNAPRILCVEDHQDTLDLFVIVLSQLDYEVVTASTVQQALEAAKSQHFDLLVLDCRLCDGSGIDLCKRIRETDKTTPILFCSALAYEKNKQEALNAGAQGYLVKPVSVSQMCETVAQLISVSRQAMPLVHSEMRKDSGDLAPSMAV